MFFGKSDMSTVHIKISLHLLTCISNSYAEISMSICASGLTLSGVFVDPIINVTCNTLFYDLDGFKTQKLISKYLHVK